ncbi:hypothetical protein Unana1_06258 [Umbelopsis nana]
MNSTHRLLRILPARSVRCYSSSSSDYIPGHRGYAPGFAPPANTRNSPKPSRKTPLETTLTSHLPSSQRKVESQSGMNTYREAVRTKRSEYAQELLTAHAQRRQQSKQKQDENVRDLNAKRQQLLTEKQAAISHEQEVIHELELDSALPSAESETLEARTAQRLQNLRSQKRAQSDARLNKLLAIYHNASNFITKENLDSKIEALIVQENRPPFLQNFEDLKSNQDFGDVQQLQRREAMLRDVMEGTVNGHKIGARAVREWVEKQ